MATKRDDDQISREDRLAGLLLLTGGRMPSWYARKNNARPKQDDRKSGFSGPRAGDDQTKFDPSDDELLRGEQSCREGDLPIKKRNIAILLFVLVTAMKVLLFPSYRSTDFLVHRHWKAATRHLDRRTEWYFDDRTVQTVHTLDYPPGFALFESFWSNGIFPIVSQYLHLVDTSCLALLDDEVVETVVDTSCVAFMRGTVLVSDVVWGYAAYVVSQQQLSIYSLLLFHPSLIMLDHIHFQYNGLLLAILLLSIHHVRYRRDYLAAVLIGLLVSLKHLYLPCCLWYVVMWMKRYGRSDPGKLLVIGLCGAAPILLSILATIDFAGPAVWLEQVSRRLFPFQRGLVHDYWAGNLFAFYAAVNKVLAKVSPTSAPRYLPMDIAPTITLGMTVLFQLPSLICVTDERIWSSFILTALASFLTQYHGHEKSILTALMPAIVVATDGESDGSNNAANLCFHAAALVSLFPLLYKSDELTFKIASTVCFLASWQLWYCHNSTTAKPKSVTATTARRRYGLVVHFVILTALSLAVLQLDVLPTIGRFEFLKLAVVSLTCGSVFVIEYVTRLYALVVGSLLGPGGKKRGEAPGRLRSRR